ncbi:MAG: PAS domain-containing protein [Azospirillaceae bacterium]
MAIDPGLDGGPDARPLAEGPEPLARLCDVWEDLRGEGGLPDRADLDPASIAFALGNVALVDIEHTPLRARYRLVGIHLVELWGRELKGRYVDEVYAEPIAAEAMQAYARVIETREPLYMRRTFRLSFGLLGYHRLMLPFHTGTPDRVDLVAVALYPTSPRVRTVMDWWCGRDRLGDTAARR